MNRSVAVVSGGAQGLGLAVCRALAPAWQLAVLDLQDSGVVRAALAGCGIGDRELGVHAYRCDIADRAAVVATTEQIARDFAAPVRALVNCAGILSSTEPGRGTDEEELHVFRVNVLGAQHLVDSLIPMMIRAGGGSVVTISSMAGRMGANAASEAYTGSKADLIGRSKQWAKVYGPKGVRCNVVAPGPINTEMISGWAEERRRDFIERTPLRRIAEPEDVAGAVRFLVSDESRHITGVTLDVNGGFYIGS